MRHPLTLILLLIAALAWVSIAASQQDNPVPTLTVPTLVPTLSSGAPVDCIDPALCSGGYRRNWRIPRRRSL